MWNRCGSGVEVEVGMWNGGVGVLVLSDSVISLIIRDASPTVFNDPKASKGIAFPAFKSSIVTMFFFSFFSFCLLLSSGGPTTRFLNGPTPMSSVMGFPVARSNLRRAKRGAFLMKHERTKPSEPNELSGIMLV